VVIDRAGKGIVSANHRTAASWRGEQVQTLEDLLRRGLRAVCVGINPSPVSVSAGHYYQGRLGKLFFKRLREAGIATGSIPGTEDDVCFAAGIGFTDIVKRPSVRASDLTAEDFRAGQFGLVEKLDQYRPSLLIFTFKKTATVLCGDFSGHGFVDGVEVAGIPAFVMPGPYERRDRVKVALEGLGTALEPGGDRP